MHWAAHHSDKPCVPGASGPDAYDCLGLVRYYFRERRGIELPDYDLVSGTPRQLASFVRATGWHRAEGRPQDEDLMLTENVAGRHVGVVVKTCEGLGLLHAQGDAQRGSVLWQPLNTLFAYRNQELWRSPCSL